MALSILNVFRRAWWPYQTTLGRVPGIAGQHDRQLHPDAEELPGLVIFRFDAPLFFANARTFRDQIRRLAAAEPRPRWIVIAAEPITDVDTTAADMLADLDEELNASGTSLVFAELKDPVRAKLERYELIGPLDPDHFFPTLDAALDAFRAQDRRRLDEDRGRERVTEFWRVTLEARSSLKTWIFSILVMRAQSRRVRERRTFAVLRPGDA